MIKLLHAADLHLDSPLAGHPEALRGQLARVPELLVRLCRRERCDLVLLAGDLFDGVPSRGSIRTLKDALEAMAVPVCIAPGNHDFCTGASLWEQEKFPENVHIFTQSTIESLDIPELECRIWGAGFTAPECPPLLEGFHVHGAAKHHIGLFHGDPVTSGSVYNAVTAAQAAASGLDYLALGHVHSTGSFRAGKTLCAWPGCTMGRGYDESGEKGVLLVQLEQEAKLRFVPLDTPRFYDLTVPVGEDAAAALAAALPCTAGPDRCRVTLTGPSEPLDLPGLGAMFPGLKYLQLRDRTVPMRDIWDTLEDDSLEGELFRQLRLLDDGTPDAARRVRLAARLVRQLLDGQEVVLP